ncbi:hypothetical protein COOONC_03587 [Cooperia oncophora]
MPETIEFAEHCWTGKETADCIVAGVAYKIYCQMSGSEHIDRGALGVVIQTAYIDCIKVSQRRRFYGHGSGFRASRPAFCEKKILERCRFRSRIQERTERQNACK